MKFQGDMHDSLKHVLTLCYYSYLSILATTTLASTPFQIVTKQENLKSGTSKKRNEIPTKTPLV